MRVNIWDGAKFRLQQWKYAGEGDLPLLIVACVRRPNPFPLPDVSRSWLAD